MSPRLNDLLTSLENLLDSRTAVKCLIYESNTDEAVLIRDIARLVKRSRDTEDEEINKTFIENYKAIAFIESVNDEDIHGA